ncbi:hypothetical protein [Streptomyces cavernae]|uniref:hypothetical protein n=1 Tax=Streptomyces cavernae TaxID=2259034 RepID=UPI0012D96B67|nr:hypothetical protein [Streptomyces cavernae]
MRCQDRYSSNAARLRTTRRSIPRRLHESMGFSPDARTHTQLAEPATRPERTSP